MTIRQLIREWYYRGDRFYCPFCNRSARVFVPRKLKRRTAASVMKEQQVAGGGSRPNSFCPWCGSKDRERLVWLYLKNHTDILSRPMRVLHIAPERKLMQELKNRPNIQYYAGDKFTEGYTYPEGVVDLDLLRLPFNDESFDVVICNHVLEHIPDDHTALQEIARVLSGGGFAILQVPISYGLEKTYEDHTIVTPAEREVHFGQSDHVRLYGRDYLSRLRVAKLIPKEIIPEDIGIEVDKYALNHDERIYRVTKRAS